LTKYQAKWRCPLQRERKASCFSNIVLPFSFVGILLPPKGSVRVSCHFIEAWFFGLFGLLSVFTFSMALQQERRYRSKRPLWGGAAGKRNGRLDSQKKRVCWRREERRLGGPRHLLFCVCLGVEAGTRTRGTWGVRAAFLGAGLIKAYRTT